MASRRLNYKTLIFLAKIKHDIANIININEDPIKAISIPYIDAIAATGIVPKGIRPKFIV